MCVDQLVDACVHEPVHACVTVCIGSESRIGTASFASDEFFRTPSGAIGIRPRPAAMGYSIEDYRRAPPLLFKRKLGARRQRMASDK